MAKALFLNPMKRGRKMAKKKTARSRKQRGWITTLKKFGGDAKAASRAYKRKKAGKPARKGSKRVAVKRVSRRKVTVSAKAPRGTKRKVSVKRTGPRTVRVTAANPKRVSRPYRRSASGRYVPSGGTTRVYRRRPNTVGRRTTRAAGSRSRASGGPSRWADEYYRSLARTRRGASSKTRSNPVKRKTSRKRRRNITRAQSRRLAKKRPRNKKGQFLRGKVGTVKRRRKATKKRATKRRVVKRTTKRRATKRKAVRRKRRAPRRLVVSRRGKRSVTVRAANPRKRRKSRRRIRTRRLSSTRTRVSLRNNPRRKRRTTRRHTTRRRNPSLSMVKSTTKSLFTKPAAMDYLTIGGGFVAGAILPRFVGKLVLKIPGLDRIPPMGIEVGIGLISSVLAGLGAQIITGKRERAIQAAGGALVGALGSMALGLLDQYIPMEGLGESAADSAVRSAVETEVQRELGMSGSGAGVGDFLTEQGVEDDLAMQGVGGLDDFVTQTEVEDAGTVSGVFGAEAELDIDESAEFDFD